MSITYYCERDALAWEIQEAGRKLLDKGINPKFVKERESGRKLSDYELCSDIIAEAKKIVASGHNAKFGCSDLHLLKEAGYAQKRRDREKGEVIDDER